MYKAHCLGTIAPAMRDDMPTFRRGVMFAVCSIRQPTIAVPDQLGILFDGDEGESPLFGHKFNAWAWINDESNCAYLWKRLNLFYSLKGHGQYPTRSASESAILALLEVPGLGIVKAAFVAQLMGFDVACLDARNVAREQRNPRAFRTDGRSPKELRGKVSAYLDETQGQAAYYWDAWCTDVAAAYGRTPEQISELHLAIVPGDYVPF